MQPSLERVSQTILALTQARYPGSICPSEVARQLASADDQWRALMPIVRDCARALALAGRLLVTQRGQILDPQALYRGAIRLQSPGKPS